MKQCINCGRKSLRLLCRRCRRKVPSGFNRRAAPDELLSEIRRNEKLKEIFKADRTLGKLSVDTVNKIFHIDNGYYRFASLSKFSFYAGEPRFSYGFDRNKVWEDIYIAFTLRDGRGRNQERRVRKIKTVPCQYFNSGKYITVEPPVSMIGMRQLFAAMIAEERERLAYLEDFVSKPENQERFKQLFAKEEH